MERVVVGRTRAHESETLQILVSGQEKQKLQHHLPFPGTSQQQVQPQQEKPRPRILREPDPLERSRVGRSQSLLPLA